MESDESDSDSEDVVIRDDGGDELRKFLAEENGEDVSDEDEDDEAFARESDSDVDPDEELLADAGQDPGRTAERHGRDEGVWQTREAQHGTAEDETGVGKETEEAEEAHGPARAARAGRADVRRQREPREDGTRRARARRGSNRPIRRPTCTPRGRQNVQPSRLLAAAPKGRKVAFGEDGASPATRHAGPSPPG